jgi:hypothetical protein
MFNSIVHILIGQPYFTVPGLSTMQRWSVIRRIKRHGGAEFSFALLMAASAMLMSIDPPEN